METYCLEPIHDEKALDRSILFGAKDENRRLPKITQEVHTRKQSDQGFTNKCVLYATMEIIENKIYLKTGRWYNTPQEIYDIVWDRMVASGLANDKWGAYINSALIVLRDENIVLTLRDEVGGDEISVTVDNVFYIEREDRINNIKMEVAFGGGVLTGINTKRAKLDYYGAMNEPFYVEETENPKEIAHAIVLSSYNELKRKNTTYSPGTWGDKRFDKGVAYFHDEHLDDLMSPLGFMIKIKADQ